MANFIKEVVEMKIKCPKCGSTRTAEVLYGLYKFEEEDIDEERIEDDYVFGGCCVENENMFCRECEIKFRDNFCGLNVLKKFKFSIGSYDGGGKYLYIDTENYFIVKSEFSSVDEYESVEEYNNPNNFRCRDYEIKDLRNEKKNLEMELFNLAYALDDIYINSWEREYKDLLIMDCQCWELELEFEHDKVIKFSGVGAYPVYWSEFIENINNLTNNMFLDN